MDLVTELERGEESDGKLEKLHTLCCRSGGRGKTLPPDLSHMVFRSLDMLAFHLEHMNSPSVVLFVMCTSYPTCNTAHTGVFSSMSWISEVQRYQVGDETQLVEGPRRDSKHTRMKRNAQTRKQSHRHCRSVHGGLLSPTDFSEHCFVMCALFSFRGVFFSFPA